MFKQYVLTAFIYVIYVASAALFTFVALQYSSPLFYWDQWDFLRSHFDSTGMTSAFLQQHGVHRQGLGGLVTYVLYNALAWSSVVDVVCMIVIVFIIGLLLLSILRKIFGKHSWIDLLIIPIVFSQSMLGAITLVPNMSHSILPVFLIVLYMYLEFFTRNPPSFIGIIKHVTQLGILFVLPFTGFGLIMIIPIVGYILIKIFLALYKKRIVADFWLIVKFGTVATSFILFFSNNYRFAADSVCSAFGTNNIDEYLGLIGGVIINGLGWFSHVNINIYFTLAILFGAVTVSFIVFMVVSGRNKVHLPYFLFGMVTGCVLLVMAFGRWCMWQRNEAFRYYPFLVPLLFVMVVFVRSVESYFKGYKITYIVILCLVGMNILVKPQGNIIFAVYNRKQQFLDCYMVKRDYADCGSKGLIYPNPKSNKRIQGYIDQLELKKGSVFYNR